jgi:hypothetical protein
MANIYPKLFSLASVNDYGNGCSPSDQIIWAEGMIMPHISCNSWINHASRRRFFGKPSVDVIIMWLSKVIDNLCFCLNMDR